MFPILCCLFQYEFCWWYFSSTQNKNPRTKIRIRIQNQLVKTPHNTLNSLSLCCNSFFFSSLVCTVDMLLPWNFASVSRYYISLRALYEYKYIFFSVCFALTETNQPLFFVLCFFFLFFFSPSQIPYVDILSSKLPFQTTSLSFFFFFFLFLCFPPLFFFIYKYIHPSLL